MLYLDTLLALMKQYKYLMFRSIANAFKALDNFLTICEEYVEQCVWNGKFIYDLKLLSATGTDNTKEKLHTTTRAIQSSAPYTSITTILHKAGHLLIQIPIIEDVLLIITDGFGLSFKYFAHYLIVLLAGLSSVFLLLQIFTDSPLLFLFMLLPTIYFNHLFLLGFFSLIEKKEDKVPYSLGLALSQLKSTLTANTFIFLLQTFLFTLFLVLGLSFASVLRMLFIHYSIDWSTSFYFWLPIVMLGLTLLVILYIAELVLSFSYSFIVQERKTALQGLHQSMHYIQTDARHSFLFYILLSIFSLIFISFFSFKSYEGGFVASIFLVSHAFLFLGFLLRRKYYAKTTVPTEQIINRFYSYGQFIMGMGLFSYIITTGIVYQIHPAILTFLEEQRPTIASTYEYIKYNNHEAGYTIIYPKPWSIYKWNTNAVTIYTNDTGTNIGGIKVNIDVHPAVESNFFDLLEAQPGVIPNNTNSENVMTKVANMEIHERNAVKYTYIKKETSQTEFQTHYLIRNNAVVYDIAFITNDKKTEAKYIGVFDRMLDSFQILPQ